jgi:hypothetical protein
MNFLFRVHGNQGNPPNWQQPQPFRQPRDPLVEQQYQLQQQQQQQRYLPQHHQQQQPQFQVGIANMDNNQLQRSDTEMTAPLTEDEFRDLDSELMSNFGHGAR